MIREFFKKKTRIKQAVSIVLLLIEIAMVIQVVFFLNAVGVERMAHHAIVSVTLSTICLIFGVFLLAGATFLRRNNTCFLALAFLLHVLMYCDVLCWCLDGLPAYRTYQNHVMNLVLFADVLAAPICLLMIRELTGMGESFRELIRSRTAFDRVELITVTVCLVALWIIWLLNYSFGFIFRITPDGVFHVGKLYYLYFSIGFLEDVFGLIRLIRAKMSFRRVFLFFLVSILPIINYWLDFRGELAEIGYPLMFLLLFMIFSEFFTELRRSNLRYSDVLELYVSGDAAQQYDGTEPDGAGKEYRGAVLLSDLRGFTAQSQKQTTEEIVDELNHYMAAMMKIVRENGGTVTEFLGDGLLCVFGAPEPTRTYADDALAAAVRMQQAMTEINDWNREKGYPVLRMGIGISTGVFTYGNIGTLQAARPMAVGKPVNSVFKAEMYALGGQIVITGEVKTALSGKPLVVQEMRHAPEGETPLSLFQVRGFAAVPELQLQKAEKPLYEPAEPKQILVRRVDGKHIDVEPGEGKLYAISPDQAVVRLPVKPEPLQYLCFTAGEPFEGTYYARVPREVAGNTVTVDLTALPEGMEEVYESLMEEKNGR